ncbi:MAG: FKBP-type peptidyl-prolyl cis-trans isomerase [Sphingobacteriales bacterium]|nr:FKBP-type peptidyl-prolyl cis-trans isomerase [Sphingobacteriales bacterium]
MKNSILFFALAALVFTGCNLSGYKHTKTGLYYKIIPSGGKKIKAGQYVKIQVNGYVHDSAFFDTRTSMAYYGVVDSVGRPHDFSEIIHLMAEGDSAVTIQFADTLLKMQGVQLPPYFRKGDKVKSCLKIVKVFDKVEDAQASYNNDLAIFREKEEAKNTASYAKAKKDLDDFVAKNKIVAAQTPKGVYVVVKQAGTGASADSGKLVGVKYKGTLIDGTLFDSNMGPDRKDTLKFVVGDKGPRSMIPGFDEAVKGQKVGTKMTIYIPAQWGYGAQGRDVIKPFSNLVFDIDVITVQDAPNSNSAAEGQQ